jgi:hypothetical protein
MRGSLCDDWAEIVLDTIKARMGTLSTVRSRFKKWLREELRTLRVACGVGETVVWAS